MKIALEHDLEPDELARSLALVAVADGLGDDVADAITKAQARAIVALPRERWLRAALLGTRARYARHVDALVANVARWLGGRLRKAEPAQAAPWTPAGATPAQSSGLPLTYAQLEELRRLVAAHFRLAGTAADLRWSIPETIWHAWQARGIVVPWLPVPEIGDAFVAGRLFQVLRDGDSYDRMRQLARATPLTRPQQLALTWAENHAAEAIQTFGNVLAGKAVHAALTWQQGAIRDLVARYVGGTLRATAAPVGPAHDLTPDERVALESDAHVGSWRGLATELRRQFLGTDAQRDWLRVAASETRLAHNVGRIQSFQEARVAGVYFLVQPDACASCKRVYLTLDGTPRIFAMADLLGNITATGGLNVGRKASLIGDPKRGWIATGLLHPFCRCRPMPAIPGFTPLVLGGHA